MQYPVKKDHGIITNTKRRKEQQNGAPKYNIIQPSHIAALARSSSSLAFASSSRARFRRLISCSFMARSYARCSSVRLGARMPSAPAIIRPATAVCFSGRRAGAPPPAGDRLCDDVRDTDGLLLLYASHGWEGFDDASVCGEMGVGGGASGPSVLVDAGEMGVSSPHPCCCASRSVSEPDESDDSEASSSQESATAGFFFLLLFFVVVLVVVVLLGLFVASGRRMSSCSGFLLLMERSLIEDSSSSVAVE